MKATLEVAFFIWGGEIFFEPIGGAEISGTSVPSLVPTACTLYIMLSFADNEKRMDASEASKRLREMARDQGNFLYTGHAMLQMAARNIANGDVRNVLMRGRIYGPPELVNETWRYKVETKNSR
jgi:hypothetical protein